MPNFRELLTTPVDQIERIRALPVGHYVAIITAYEFGTTRGKGTDYCRFMFRPEVAADDVDEAALEGVDLSTRELRLDMWITPKSLDRFDRFLEAVLGENTTKRTIDDRLPEMKGQRVMIQVQKRTNQDGTESDYNDIGTVVHYEPDEVDGPEVIEPKAAAA